MSSGRNGYVVGYAALIFFCLSNGSYATAQTPPGETAFDGLKFCRTVADDAERLACFDRASANLIKADDAGDISVVDREQIEKTKRGLFGFSLPKLGIFADKDGTEQRIDKLNSTITAITAVGRRDYLITIAEGSRWRVSAPPRRFRPEVGDPIELERAALGSFWLRVDGAPGVKGRRTE